MISTPLTKRHRTSRTPRRPDRNDHRLAARLSYSDFKRDEDRFDQLDLSDSVSERSFFLPLFRNNLANAAYFRKAQNGLYVRMALLALVAGRAVVLNQN